MTSQINTFFLSSVNRDLKMARKEIAGDLETAGYKVHEESNFAQTGRGSLEKLYSYIGESDAIMHLIGKEPGSPISAFEFARFLKRYPDFLARLPVLRSRLASSGEATYSQFELYAALDLEKPCFVFVEKSLIKEKSKNTQKNHFEVLDSVGHDISRFSSTEDLIKKALLAVAFQSRRTRPPTQSLNVSTYHLPVTGFSLIGRDEELELLSDSLSSDAIAIVDICGFAGMGKTCLVNRWLQGLINAGADIVENIFGWSFSRQGSDGVKVSSDSFLEAIWDFLDLGGSPPRSAQEKARIIASKLGETRTLLVLDGIETLQKRTQKTFELEDWPIFVFLQSIRARKDSLCILTTRFPIDELKQLDGSTRRQIMLDCLTPTEGKKLLKENGVTGDPSEIIATVTELKGHCLSLILLANFLTTAFDGDIIHRYRLPMLSSEEDYGDAVDSIMETYDQLYAGREKILLRLMGFSVGSVSKETLSLLTGHPSLAHLKGGLSFKSEIALSYGLERLVKGQILTKTAEGRYDCHPMVREFAHHKLMTEFPLEWEQGNRILHEHTLARCKPDPDDLDDLQPYYEAVVYACRSGNHQKAYREIVLTKIWRNYDFFVTDQLGAFGWNLALLSEFFSDHWTQLGGEALSSGDEAMLYNEVGFSLLALGQFEDAQSPLEHSLETSISANIMTEAARTAANLHFLHFVSGHLQKAVEYCERSICFADQSPDVFRQAESRTDLAYCFLMMGKTEQALEAVQQSLDRKAEIESMPNHYFRMDYCRWMVLLEAGDFDQVELELGESGNTLGLSNTPLCRALFLLADLELSLRKNSAPQFSLSLPDVGRKPIDEMLELFVHSGLAMTLPLGWIAKGRYHSGRGELAEAEAALSKAISISQHCEMKLHIAETQVELARLAGLSGDREGFHQHLEQAQGLSEACEYLQLLKTIGQLKAASPE